MRCVCDAFAVAWRECATFSVLVRVAADAHAHNAAWTAHRVENVDVGVNDAGNLGPQLHRAAGVGREPSAFGVGSGGRSHQSGEKR